MSAIADAIPVAERRGARSWDYGGIALTILTVICAGLWFFPIYWIANMSLKGNLELGAVPPTLVPQQPSLDNYYRLLFVLGFDRYLWNSVAVAAGSTLIGLSAGALCALLFTPFAATRAIGRAC